MKEVKNIQMTEDEFNALLYEIKDICENYEKEIEIYKKINSNNKNNAKIEKCQNCDKLNEKIYILESENKRIKNEVEQTEEINKKFDDLESHLNYMVTEFQIEESINKYGSNYSSNTNRQIDSLDTDKIG